MIIIRNPLPKALKNLFHYEITFVIYDTDNRIFRCMITGEDVTSIITQQAVFSGKGARTWFANQRYLLTPSRMYLFAGNNEMVIGELTWSINKLHNVAHSDEESGRNFLVHLNPKFEYVIQTTDMNSLPDNVFIIINDNLYGEI